MFPSNLSLGQESADGILDDIHLTPAADSLARSAFNEVYDFEEEGKRKHWKANSLESRCNFEYQLKLSPRAGITFISIWKKSIVGRTLTEIKEDEKMVDVFIENMCDTIKKVIGDVLREGDWGLITAPKRRHTTRNFATLICLGIAKNLNIPFYEDALSCHSKHRVGAVFDVNIIPKERNIICFDDIVTTGSTLRSIYEAIKPLQKNIVFFAGINN